jgi:integrase
MPVTLTATTLPSYAKQAIKAEKRTETPDAIVPGLWLVTQPTGAQSWAVRYRTADGRSRKLTLGSVSKVLDLKAAREKARRELQAVHDGKDPARLKKLVREHGKPADDTLAAHIELYKQKHVAGLKPNTSQYVIRELDRMQDRFPGRTLDSLKKSELIDFIESPKGPAGQVCRWKVVKCFLTWCAGRSDSYVSPIAGLKRPAKETTRDRTLSDDELKTVWESAVKVGGVAGALARLLILTGCRRNEIMGLERKELGTEAIELPGKRTKNGRPHAVALTPAMRAALDDCPKDGKYVLNGSDRPSGDHSGIKARLAPLDTPWTFHDLRRSCASGMQRLGIPPHIIELCLNHRSGTYRGVAGIYQRHGHEAEVKTAFEAWSMHIERLTAEKKKAA